MGERAVGGAATPADIDAMEAALHAALAEGALGFSTSQVHTHNDGDGQPVPSRAASRQEMERLAAAVRGHEGTTVELIVRRLPQRVHRRGIDFLATMSLLADRPVNWNVLGVSAMNPDGAWSQLAAGTAAADARGHRRRADPAPHHAAAAQLRARRHPRRAARAGARSSRSRYPSAWRRSRTPRPAAGSTPARSPTRPGSCGTWPCGTA